MLAISEALNFLVEFFSVDIWTYFIAFFQQLVEWLIISKIKMKIFIVTLGWEIAGGVLGNLGLGELITSSFSSLDSQILSYMNFFRFIDAINILLQALITRFTLRITGLL